MAAASGSTASEDKRICSRGHWRPGEDEKLRRLVELFGPQNWNSIAVKLEGRSGKSCRLRWFNQLDPRINRRPFTEEEEERLLAAHRAHGNKWALIARLFPGRTDNAVKNHWHVMKARRQRERRRHLIVNRGAPYHHLFASSLNRIDFSSPSPVDLRAPAFTFSVHPFDQKKLTHDFGMVSNKDEGSREGDHVPFIDFLGVGVIT